MTEIKYKILYHFENDIIDILEIKRIDIQDKDKSKIYYWFFFEKCDNLISKLEFQSMESSEMEYRVFDKCNLCFDEEAGVCKKDNMAYMVKRLPQDMSITLELQEAINNYFRDK